VLDSALPRPIARTFYARVGDWTVVGMVAVALLATLRARRVSR